MLKYKVMVEKLEDIFTINFDEKREVIQIRESKYPFEKQEFSKKEFMILISELYGLIDE